MKRFKIGLRLESLDLPLRRGLDEASRLGAAGVQIDAIGDLSPDVLSQSGRRAFLALLRTLNLELSALGCPLRRGLDEAENQQPRLEYIRKVMDLAYELGPRCVVLTAGQIPENADSPEGRRMRESLDNLATHGDRCGTTIALETGLESGPALAEYLATFNTGHLGVNLDPANLMLHGFSPGEAIAALRDRIVHIHARDCRRGSASRAAREVPLGHGDIDWLQFVESLEEIEYRGWLAVEREEGTNRAAEVGAGVAFLRRLIAV
ncbi:MAG: sugar phosphate isomerase/epimerase family protein [Gemmataceae bacterium]